MYICKSQEFLCVWNVPQNVMKGTKVSHVVTHNETEHARYYQKNSFKLV